MTRRLRLLVTAACLPLLLTGLASVAGASVRIVARTASCAEPACPVSYHGGKVQTSPKVYLLFWGPLWKTSDSGAATYVKHFYAGLGARPDDWSSTTEQYANHYGAHPAISGSVLKGVYVDSSTPPKQVTARQIGVEAETLYARAGLSDPRDTQIVVATQSGTCPLHFRTPSGSPCDDPAGTYCAWHAPDGSNGITVINLPYQPDAGKLCGENSVSNGSASKYDGFSMYGGAEFADSVTDPYPRTGWIDKSDASGGEISDKCRGQGAAPAEVTLATGQFAMQSLWSNAANRCVFASPTLTVSTKGSGSGAVTGGGGTIACEPRCTASYPPGTTVTLTPTAASGSVFTGWQGAGCTGYGVCVLTMTKPLAVVATFVPAATIPLTVSGAGAVTGPAGLDCGTNCQAQVPRGSSVTFTARPDSGAAFAGWSGACQEMASARCTFTANDGPSVGARFVVGKLYRAASGKYGNSWSATTCPCYFGGTGRESTTAGATATFAFTGRAVTLVSDQSPAGGSFRVYVDGTLTDTLSDYSAATKAAATIWSKTFTKPGTHVVRLVNDGTSGHARVAVDGFIVAEPMFGTTMTNGVAAESAKFGFQPPVIRDFSYGLPGPINVSGSAAVIYSFEKMPTSQQFQTWLNSLNPNQHVWWAYRHEVDREIRHHETTLATWKRQMAKLLKLAAGKPNLTATIILTGYEYTKAGHKGFYKPSDFWVPGAQALGGDLDGISAKTYPDFGPQITGMQATAANVGSPELLVPEFGAPTVHGDKSGTAKAQWMRSWARKLFQGGFSAVIYYDANGEALVKRAEITAWSHVMSAW